jgi:hypothetical protein
MPRYMTGRGWAFLAVLAVVGAVLAAAGPASADIDLDRMYSLSTEHYNIHTDISPQFTALVGRHMEAIYNQYARQLSNYGEVTGKFTVVVFAHQKQYTEYTDGQALGSTGVFFPALQTLAANAQGRTIYEVLHTLYHEGFHQFMWAAVSQDPPP